MTPTELDHLRLLNRYEVAATAGVTSVDLDILDACIQDVAVLCSKGLWSSDIDAELCALLDGAFDK